MTDAAREPYPGWRDDCELETVAYIDALLAANAELRGERDRAHKVMNDNLALANAINRDGQQERNTMIKTLRAKYSAIEIADMVGLTRQRIHQILNEPPVVPSFPDRLTLVERLESAERERDNLLGINAAWAKQHALEKERGDKWMVDCEEAERKLAGREGDIEKDGK